MPSAQNPQPDPGAFRLYAFVEDWVAPIEAQLGYGRMSWEEASPSSRLNSTLVQEALEWVRIGQRVGYFADLEAPFAHRFLGAEAAALTGGDYSGIDAPSQFGHLLAQAQDDLSSARHQFLEVTLFADDEQFNDSLAEVRSVAQRLLDDSSARFPDEVVDQIAWVLDGAESDIQEGQATPASWRGPLLVEGLAGDPRLEGRWDVITDVRESIRYAVEQSLGDGLSN